MNSRFVVGFLRHVNHCVWGVWLLSCVGMATLAHAQKVTKGSSGGQRFQGWETMRVIKQDGGGARARVADLDSDGQDELIVVNKRQARLDIYRKRLPGEVDDFKPNAMLPNRLPQNLGFELIKVPIKRLPVDMQAVDLDKDGLLEWVILTRSPNRIEVWQSKQKSLKDQKVESAKYFDYQRVAGCDLLPGSYVGRSQSLLIKPVDGKPLALISTDQGFQTVNLGSVFSPSLEEGQETQVPESSDFQLVPNWIEPKSSGEQRDWWWVDADADGVLDLVEWVEDGQVRVRWWPGRNNDERQNHEQEQLFFSPRPLYDQRVLQMRLLESPAGVTWVMRTEDDGEAIGRYGLGESESSSFGHQDRLSWSEGAMHAWAGFSVQQEPMLALFSQKQPEMTLYGLQESGWEYRSSFPVISDIENVEPLLARPGVLLLASKGSADLSVTYWDGTRMTYPKPFASAVQEGVLGEDWAKWFVNELDASVEQSEKTGRANQDDSQKLLGLGRVGQTTWWAVRLGEQIKLYIWPVDRQQPLICIGQCSEKTEKVLWLGETRLAVQEQYARGLKLLILNGEDQNPGDKTSATTRLHTPDLFQGVRLERFVALEDRGEIRPVYRVDGVLQWLDDQMVAVDQVMLPDGAALASLTLLDDGSGWGLEVGGHRVHKMMRDEANIFRSVLTERVTGVSQVIDDPVLGLLLFEGSAVTRVRPGRRQALVLEQAIEASIGQPETNPDPQIDTLFAVDVTGVGEDQLLLLDHAAHQLTLLDRSNEVVNQDVLDIAIDDFVPLMSWPVFEDGQYPYGDEEYGREADRPQPWAVTSLDADGDGYRDLALFVHDRLLIYLGRQNYEKR